MSLRCSRSDIMLQSLVILIPGMRCTSKRTSSRLYTSWRRMGTSRIASPSNCSTTNSARSSPTPRGPMLSSGAFRRSTVLTPTPWKLTRAHYRSGAFQRGSSGCFLPPNSPPPTHAWLTHARFVELGCSKSKW